MEWRRYGDLRLRQQGEGKLPGPWKGTRFYHWPSVEKALAENDSAKATAEFERIAAAAAEGAKLGLEIHAGHGLDYASAEAIARLPEIAELNIGHFLVGEAIFVGLGNSIARMRAAMERGRAATGAAA